MKYNRITYRIAWRIAMLFLLSLLLLNFVMLSLSKSNYLEREQLQDQILFHVVYQQLADDMKGSAAFSLLSLKKPGLDTAVEGWAGCLFVIDPQGRKTFLAQEHCTVEDDVEPLLTSALKHGKAFERQAGAIWHIWGIEPLFFIKIKPFFNDEKINGALVLVSSRESIFRVLQTEQKILLFYTVFNTVVFALLGILVIRQIVLRPLKNIVKQTEAYKGDHAFAGAQEHGDEFNALSTAINRMLHRISDDKRRLQDHIEELKSVNFKLKMAQKETVRAEKLASVGRLSAGVAHEIGNPLGIAIGYMELLKGDNLPVSERRDCVARAEEELNRINRIIRGLLDLARKPDQTFEKISVLELLEEIIHAFQAMPIVRGKELVSRLECQGVTINGNRALFQQVLYNLLLNACDAFEVSQSAAPPTIILEAQGPAGQQKSAGQVPLLTLRVMDNGIGISKENLDKIFDPFYTSKEIGKGTGLGLSISYSIIQSMGGELQVDSVEGRGTSVTITLPVDQAHPNSAVEN